MFFRQRHFLGFPNQTKAVHPFEAVHLAWQVRMRVGPGGPHICGVPSSRPPLAVTFSPPQSYPFAWIHLRVALVTTKHIRTFNNRIVKLYLHCTSASVMCNSEKNPKVYSRVPSIFPNDELFAGRKRYSYEVNSLFLIKLHWPSPNPNHTSHVTSHSRNNS